MKSPAFDYVRVDSVADALSAYNAMKEDAVYLAGGHSLVPSLALRLQAPAQLIDISGITELSGIYLENGWLRIGAMTRHAQAISDPLIAKHAALLAAAAPYVAHPAIRNRGTIGGSLSLADPASEFPAVAVAMGAEMEVIGAKGARRIPADAFFVGLYETAMAPGEILRAVFVPPVRPGQIIGFDEIARRRGDYAMVGAAVQAVAIDGVIEAISIALFSVGERPTPALQAAKALRGGKIDTAGITAAKEALSEDLDPPDDPQFPASARVHLARVLLGRILANLEASA
ncbi:xanthine dehydrogenase family protein subunit M [Aquicoccus sp. G2-2]|uniref:FAD binding domain-containing protein n=1 Tax=Aquicoccus sp. G2-2 TaxID=3092120 RepID=UPI002AE07CF6|nr:xanthine dehydrogenase family protein subunit M [Aquicoccus sp. G2-2]MEA1114591.1 xanthine dehydrogenase family protein subunit M [Aquicoccus sp. G2-2]